VWQTVALWLIFGCMALSIVLWSTLGPSLGVGAMPLGYLAMLPVIGLGFWILLKVPFGYALDPGRIVLRMARGRLEVRPSDVIEIRFPKHSSWGRLTHRHGSVSLVRGILPGLYDPLVELVLEENPSAKVTGRS